MRCAPTSLLYNDFLQVRYRITHKEALGPISDETGCVVFGFVLLCCFRDRNAGFFRCAMTTKGVFVPPGKAPPPGEEKLFIEVENKDIEVCVLLALNISGRLTSHRV